MHVQFQYNEYGYEELISLGGVSMKKIFISLLLLAGLNLPIMGQYKIDWENPTPQEKCVLAVVTAIRQGTNESLKNAIEDQRRQGFLTKRMVQSYVKLARQERRNFLKKYLKAMKVFWGLFLASSGAVALGTAGTATTFGLGGGGIIGLLAFDKDPMALLGALQLATLTMGVSIVPLITAFGGMSGMLISSFPLMLFGSMDKNTRENLAYLKELLKEMP